MKHFFRACTYSYAGFLTLLRECAFRQELLLVTACFIITAFLGGIESFFTLFPWGTLVLITEALNTAIENCVDLCTSERHPLAKAAKDTASFACGVAVFTFVFQFLLTLWGFQ